MLTEENAKTALLKLLQRKSLFRGDFTLSSGAKSNYYVDCRLTTLDPEGAWLVGECVHGLVRREAVARCMAIRAVGGLTMGADPIALAVGMYSHFAKDVPALQVFAVRKAAKAHGQTRLIEGNFKKGDTVVVIDDTITTGASTITAINAVKNEGGTVAFVVALVDREESGRGNIEQLGLPVFALFTKSDLLGTGSK